MTSDARPAEAQRATGFDRLVAAACAGEVGAVLCFDASRLSRNGRDRHHLLELRGLVGARVIDTDGAYDPCRPNALTWALGIDRCLANNRDAIV
jgi:DNA invertase Pin-like site-specific DNA recombinase